MIEMIEQELGESCVHAIATADSFIIKIAVWTDQMRDTATRTDTDPIDDLLPYN